MYDPSRGYPTVVPCLRYDDPVAAAEWLTSVLGARRMVRAQLPDGWVGHVELQLHGSVILIGRRTEDGTRSASLTQVFVDDVEAACTVAEQLGGSVLEAPGDRPWGIRQAALADPDGHQWVVCRHLRDVDPEQWFGTVFPPLLG